MLNLQILQSPRLINFDGRDLTLANNAHWLEWPAELVLGITPSPENENKNRFEQFSDWRYGLRDENRQAAYLTQTENRTRREAPSIDIDKARRQLGSLPVRDRRDAPAPEEVFRPTVSALYDVKHQSREDDERSPYQVVLETGELRLGAAFPDPEATVYVFNLLLNTLEFESRVNLMNRLVIVGIERTAAVVLAELKTAYQPVEIEKALVPVADEVRQIQGAIAQKIRAIVKEINAWQTRTLAPIRCGDEIDPILTAANSVIALGFIADLAAIGGALHRCYAGLEGGLRGLSQNLARL